MKRFRLRSGRLKMSVLSLLSVLVLCSALLTSIVFKPQHISAATFTHGGILYTQADFDRAKQKIAMGAGPWIDAWNAGKNTAFASQTYTPTPVKSPQRWGNPEWNVGNDELFNDSEAALVQAIMWKVSNDSTEANNARLKAEEIVNAWSSTLNQADSDPVGGDGANVLAGITGVRFAAAVDILRADSNWVNAGKFTAAKDMLKNEFYPNLKAFLDTDYSKNADYNTYPYWVRGAQEILAMQTVMAIGIACDDINLYNEAVNHFKNGNHNGRATYYLFPTSNSNLAQSEESGRDQPHNMLGIGALANMAQMSYIQRSGDSSFEDLYEYSGRLIMKGVEYSAKYNSGGTVPFTPLYTSSVHSGSRVEMTVASQGRAELRPIFEMVWNHYHYKKGVADASATDPLYYTKLIVDSLRPEPLHIDHQPFTTLLYAQDPILSGQIYTLRNPNSGKLLDVANSGTANGTNVQIWQDGGGDNQRFYIYENGDGTYRLIGVQSGKALDVSGGSTADGANVQIWTYGGVMNQKWKIIANSDGTYKLLAANTNNKVLDINGAGTANGTNVQIWTDNGGIAQKWQLVRGGVESGAKYALLNPNSGKVADVAGASTADGANVQIWTDNSGTGTNQQWTITANGDGTYKLIGVQSGKVMEVYGFGKADGTNVDIWASNNGAHQKWKIVSNADGTFKLVDSNSNKVLDVDGSGTANGTNVQIWLNSGSAGQKWKLVRK